MITPLRRRNATAATIADVRHGANRWFHFTPGWNIVGDTGRPSGLRPGRDTGHSARPEGEDMERRPLIGDSPEATGLPGLPTGPDGRVQLGGGEHGGKASGLLEFSAMLSGELSGRSSLPMPLEVPGFIVIGSDYFREFVSTNGLSDLAHSDEPEERVASAFMQGDLSPQMVGSLWRMISETHIPLAVRSSSLLEDSLHEPFAGIYETKMVPNNDPSDETRFRKLVDAIKLVYASTYFPPAREYARGAGRSISDESMAVIIQRVVGTRYGDRFYPLLSGVGRSFNYYPFGKARQEDGVVDLALGLGKTIVDGEPTWSYCPRHPRRSRPFGSVKEMLDSTQRSFWAVNMGMHIEFDPLSGAEHLKRASLEEADYDDTLRWVASTYDPRSDMVVHGTGIPGPRLLDFAPILKDRLMPLNDTILALLEACRERSGADVEIEFAVSGGGRDEPPRLGFLQMRPMVSSKEIVELPDSLFSGERTVVSSSSSLGNCLREDIGYVVYVRPGPFDASLTGRIAAEITALNRKLGSEDGRYVLIGFGRWGSSDPWLGIPVTWGQISGACAIVEVMSDRMNVEPSQGSHFFHNLASFGIPYLCVSPDRPGGVDWDWLEGQNEVASDCELVRCVEPDTALRVIVDGRTGRGVVVR